MQLKVPCGFFFSMSKASEASTYMPFGIAIAHRLILHAQFIAKFSILSHFCHRMNHRCDAISIFKKSTFSHKEYVEHAPFPHRKVKFLCNWKVRTRYQPTTVGQFIWCTYAICTSSIRKLGCNGGERRRRWPSW